MLEAQLPILLSTGLLFTISIILGKLSNKIHTPRMVGYLLAGIVFGPSGLELFSYERVHQDFDILIDLTLAFIAFSLGEHLNFKELASSKKEVTIITIAQGICASIFAGVAIYICLPFILDLANIAYSKPMVLAVALVLGAASAATAPAAIMSLISEYNAKGHFKNVLVSVVALDDVLTIMLYGFAITFASSLINDVDLNIVNLAWQPSKKIIIACTIGIAGGLLLKLALPLFKEQGQIFALVFGTVLMIAGLSNWLGFSPLLPALILGITVSNLVPKRRNMNIGGAHDAFLAITRIREAIFSVFFLLAGAHIDFSIALQATAFALVITIFRFSGKIVGCRLGSQYAKSQKEIRHYLGLAMLPAAGVMVGLTIDASETLRTQQEIAPIVDLMVSAVLGATLINELTTPFIVRYALKKAKSID